MINLFLFDSNVDITNAFKNHFADLPNVEVKHCFLEELPSYDCLVSPANSFGLMDGGIDRAITKMFGKQLMGRVQKHIIDNYAGEQPVGTSFLINLDERKHHFLAHTPTMRIPMNISDTSNVYKAMKAMLFEVVKFNRTEQYPIETVACSGLGTYTGGVSPDTAARQMRLAYEHVMNVPSSITWEFALSRHAEIVESI